MSVKWAYNLLQCCGLLFWRFVQRWPVSNHQVLRLAAEKPGISKSSLERCSAANSFRNLVGMWSGPSALWGFRPCISFKTPAWSTLNECISGNLLPFMAGIYTDVSYVMTLLNCSFIMVALVLGSLCVIPPLWMPPLLSHFLHLMNV